jgi:predicted NBD/HSP70 family sugar kinase
VNKSAIGLDLGGTKIAAALFPTDGGPTHREAVALEGRAGPDVGALLTRWWMKCAPRCRTA